MHTTKLGTRSSRSKIIEKELSFLERMDKEYKGLETMRSLIGGASAYPAIEKYYTFLKKKHCK